MEDYRGAAQSRLLLPGLAVASQITKNPGLGSTFDSQQPETCSLRCWINPPENLSARLRTGIRLGWSTPDRCSSRFDRQPSFLNIASTSSSVTSNPCSIGGGAGGRKSPYFCVINSRAANIRSTNSRNAASILS